ncbi:hypothetical protein QTP70_012451, partial [Hemibagrus guttatus]
VHKD